ncbi:MAG: hypothetical protein AAF653_21635, partial [Chloroflexota bacterium]
AALPGLGLSLGIMQYMHTKLTFYWYPTTPIWFHYLLMPYQYTSHQFHIYPMIWLWGITILITVAIALSTTGLLVAVGIFITTLFENFRLVRLTLLWLTTVSIIILLAIISAYFAPDRCIFTHCPSSPSYPYTEIEQERNRNLAIRRKLESHSIANSTFIGGSVMLNTNIMKPMPLPHRPIVNTSLCFWLGRCGESSMYSTDPSQASTWLKTRRRGHLLYLLRHIVTATYGVANHIALTILLLGLAARRHP